MNKTFILKSMMMGCAMLMVSWNIAHAELNFRIGTENTSKPTEATEFQIPLHAHFVDGSSVTLPQIPDIVLPEAPIPIVGFQFRVKLPIQGVELMDVVLDPAIEERLDPLVPFLSFWSNQEINASEEFQYYRIGIFIDRNRPVNLTHETLILHLNLRVSGDLSDVESVPIVLEDLVDERFEFRGFFNLLTVKFEVGEFPVRASQKIPGGLLFRTRAGAPLNLRVLR